VTVVRLQVQVGVESDAQPYDSLVQRNAECSGLASKERLEHVQPCLYSITRNEKTTWLFQCAHGFFGIMRCAEGVSGASEFQDDSSRGD
jgi:hypothetical protein